MIMMVMVMLIQFIITVMMMSTVHDDGDSVWLECQQKRQLEVPGAQPGDQASQGPRLQGFDICCEAAKWERLKILLRAF